MKLLLALLCTAGALAAQSVEGKVVNRLTGAPLDGVKVTLFSGNKSLYETTTDGRGAFRFDGVKPGSYNPHTEKHGFIPAGSSLRTIQVAEGGEPVSMNAQMMPMGKVSGRVLDGDGKGVRGALVEMLATFGGPSKTTDGNGNFTFDELVPATYTLSVRPPRAAKAMEIEGRRVALVRTFYPGVTERSAAGRITIAPGSEIFGQDVRMIAAPVYRIRGVALDHKGERAAGVGIELADSSRYSGEGDAQVHSTEDGTFEFRDIAPGDWRLTARAARDGIQLKAFQSLQLGDRDIDRYELRLGLPFSISGTVALQAPDGSPLPVKNTLVNLAPAVGGSDFLTLKPDETGKFTADGVYPGVYQVVAVQPGPQLYLAGIRLGDRESTDGRVEFLSGGISLNVIYRSDGGTLRGTVEECGAATVLLVPQDPPLRRWEYIRSGKCKANGGYEFAAVRPGEYYALALNPSDPAFNFMSTDLNQGHLNAAVSVTVRPNEATLADLRVTR